MRPCEARNKEHWKVNDPYDGSPKTCPQCGETKARSKVNPMNSTERNWDEALVLGAIKVSRSWDLSAPTITLEWIHKQIEKQHYCCYWTGKKMVRGNGNNQGRLDQVALDRLDPRLGFTPENTVLVHLAMKRARRELGLAHWEAYLRLLGLPAGKP